MQSCAHHHAYAVPLERSRSFVVGPVVPGRLFTVSFRNFVLATGPHVTIYTLN